MECLAIFLIVTHSHSDQTSQAQLMKIIANNGKANGIYGYDLMTKLMAVHSRDLRFSKTFLTLSFHYIYKIMEKYKIKVEVYS